ncbi:minor capsid protein [Monoglobus pectinilyticus]|jgi:SPP1 gp7 family putative phage head morphogenesis protein|uniref:minor capsid protein n=2 Tax=Monoglobus pectinilyticus TaxID=1981510 RepID=UPI002069AC04|nr:MAG TPA: minor capsid protein [Caudoviricetes sp.]
MRSADYWLRVALMRELDAHNRGAYTIQELRRMYDSIIKDIDKEIKKIFNTYKSGVQITAEEAEHLINKAAQGKIADRLSEILKDTEDPKQRLELMRKIHAQAYGARISRLEAVKLNVYAYFKEKALTEIEKTKTLYNTVIEESYYRTVHDVAKGCNVGINFSLIPERAVNEMLESKWHGEQFSDRVWNNTAKVAEQSQKIITEGLMSHAGYTQMAARLAEIMETSKYNAQRLVNTQVSYFMNMAELRAYEELGIEQYKYLATLDERTCESCSPLDNKIFKVSEAVGGVNYPPMHPHCRCTTTMPTDYARRWARDPLTGKGYKIKGMNYNEWIESLNPEQRLAFDLHVRQYKNLSGDKKQYAKYVEVLGKKNVPKTFALFQDLKYNDNKLWESLKDYYKSRSTNMISAFTSFEDYKKYKQIISDELIGLTTVDGIKIKSQSKHFIERVFGTNKDPITGRTRNGVEIKDIKEALLHGRVRKKKCSTKYVSDKCEVSINQRTGNLIQTNPHSEIR